MKVIFFGTSDFALPVFEMLVQSGYEIPLVITTPGDSPVKSVAEKLGLKVIQPPSLKIEEFENYLKIENCELKIDDSTIGLVASYGKIIPVWLIERFPHGLLNVHPSLLPKYRGPSPIQSAILNGDTETGVSLMLIDAEVDHGPLLATEKTTIGAEKTNLELSERLFRLGGELLIKTLPDYLAGKTAPQPQDHSQATFTKKFTPEAGKIDWQKPAQEIYNRIRALNPEPGTHTITNNQIIKITKAHCTTSHVVQLNRPGELILQNKNLFATTSDNYLEILELQPAGKKPMSARDFINGYRGQWPIKCE